MTRTCTTVAWVIAAALNPAKAYPPSDSLGPGDPTQATVGSNQGLDLGVDEAIGSLSPPPSVKLPLRRSPSSAEPVTVPPLGKTTSTVPWYRTSIPSLALVLGLIALSALGLKKLYPRQGAADGSMLRVVGRTPLGVKQSLAIVQVGRRLLVLGVTAEHVTLLAQLQDEDEVARLQAKNAVRISGEKEAFDTALAAESSKYGSEKYESVSKSLPHAEAACDAPQAWMDLVEGLRRGGPGLKRSKP